MMSSLPVSPFDIFEIAGEAAQVAIGAAFELAVKTGRGSVHMADKSNAMKHAHELWRRVFREVAAEYDGIEAHHQYVDALCFNLIRDPSQSVAIRLDPAP